MRIDGNLTDQAVLDEIGHRLARRRLERNLSQLKFAEQAGLGRRTVQRLEEGEPVQIVSFIRVLRAIGLLDALDRLIPEPLPSPLNQTTRGSGRRRARAREIGRAVESEPWTWGDESSRRRDENRRAISDNPGDRHDR